MQNAQGNMDIPLDTELVAALSETIFFLWGFPVLVPPPPLPRRSDRTWNALVNRDRRQGTTVQPYPRAPPSQPSPALGLAPPAVLDGSRPIDRFRQDTGQSPWTLDYLLQICSLSEKVRKAKKDHFDHRYGPVRTARSHHVRDNDLGPFDAGPATRSPASLSRQAGGSDAADRESRVKLQISRLCTPVSALGRGRRFLRCQPAGALSGTLGIKHRQKLISAFSSVPLPPDNPGRVAMASSPK